jgi:hypothetical protein
MPLTSLVGLQRTSHYSFLDRPREAAQLVHELA